MKALSVRQPWAWAILHGGKDIENRTWSTGYRGPILIHAGFRMDEVGMEEIFEKYGVRPPDDLAHGGIVGRADLIECVTQHPSRWFEGPYGFVLANVQPLPFVAMRGKPGLFEGLDLLPADSG